jgi:transposase-like protein
MDMQILAKCPACGGRMNLAINHISRRQRCRGCGRLFKMPNTQQLEKALQVAGNAGKEVFIDEDGRIYG